LRRLKKRWIFRLLAVALVLGMGLPGAELMLRWREAALRASDRPDPGMIQYDPQWGWRLTPGWTGAHHHRDFALRYRINERGFRYDPAQPKQRRGRVVAVVGDSFAFGLGVNDEETFTSLLNRRGSNTFLNLSVPGYSTDQEALLIEAAFPEYRPDDLWLMVYVGNDLLDNQFARPLQFHAAKPRFERGPAGLVLQNVPAPSATPALREPPPDLETAVLGEEAVRADWGVRLARRWALARLLRSQFARRTDYRARLEAHLRPATELFADLLARIRESTRRAGIELRVFVLAGRSFVEEPGSLSAQYQQFFAESVLQACRAQAVPAYHVATELAAEFQRRGERLYHPHDGHLNRRGHEVVCRTVAEVLATAHAAVSTP